MCSGPRRHRAGPSLRSAQWPPTRPRSAAGSPAPASRAVWAVATRPATPGPSTSHAPDAKGRSHNPLAGVRTGIFRCRMPESNECESHPITVRLKPHIPLSPVSQFVSHPACCRRHRSPPSVISVLSVVHLRLLPPCSPARARLARGLAPPSRPPLFLCFPSLVFSASRLPVCPPSPIAPPQSPICHFHFFNSPLFKKLSAPPKIFSCDLGHASCI